MATALEHHRFCPGGDCQEEWMEGPPDLGWLDDAAEEYGDHCAVDHGAEPQCCCNCGAKLGE